MIHDTCRVGCQHLVTRAILFLIIVFCAGQFVKDVVKGRYEPLQVPVPGKSIFSSLVILNIDNSETHCSRPTIYYSNTQCPPSEAGRNPVKRIKRCCGLYSVLNYSSVLLFLHVTNSPVKITTLCKGGFQTQSSNVGTPKNIDIFNIEKFDHISI